MKRIPKQEQIKRALNKSVVWLRISTEDGMRLEMERRVAKVEHSSHVEAYRFKEWKQSYGWSVEAAEHLNELLEF